MTIVLALLVVPLLLASPGSSADVLTFAATPLPAYGGEPNVEVGAEGEVFVVFPGWYGSRLFRRDAGATTFTDLGHPNVGFGGADEDIALGPGGLVALAGMYWKATPLFWSFCTSVTLSRDGGDTWEPPVGGICADHGVDRPYVALDDAGGVYVLQHAYCCVGQHSLHYSPDGFTYIPVGLSTPIGDFPGNLFHRDGRLYATSTCSDVFVCMTSATSLAPQPVWTPNGAVRMTNTPAGLKHSTGAIDDAGHVYLAWSEIRSGGTHVFVARSTDGGITFGPSERVSSGNAATMPWIVAGAEGRAAVAWYESDRRGHPNDMPATAAWTPRVAVRTDWGAAGAWETAALSTRVNHYGPLCVNGAACHSQGIDRDLLDYFELAVGPDGRLHAAYSDDVTWLVWHVEQVGGTRLR